MPADLATQLKQFLLFVQGQKPRADSSCKVQTCAITYSESITAVMSARYSCAQNRYVTSVVTVGISSF
jgi:hypothetical protein